MNLSSSKTGSTSCQCTTTLYGENKETQKSGGKSVTVANYARRFPLGRWSFLGPGLEKNWFGTYSDKPDGDRNKTVEQIMLNFAESSHPILRATSAVERGELRSKEMGKKSIIHFNGSEENVVLILRTVISVNQLSIYGAVACAENCPKIPEFQGHSMQTKIWKQ